MMAVLHTANSITSPSGSGRILAPYTATDFRRSRLSHDLPCKSGLARPRIDRHSCVCAQISSCLGGDGAFQAPYGLFLHDLMDQAGIDTTHAKASRKGFVKEVAELARIEEESSNSSLNLARAALEVSAEDDALVSHSTVALPVDSYLERLNSMAMEFAKHHMPAHPHTPDAVLTALDNYLYGYKSFQRTSPSQTRDARDSYLNMVLTRRLGRPALLAIIYSELVKVLKSWGVLDFVVDMVPPMNKFCLPQPVVRMGPSQNTSRTDPKSCVMLTPRGLLAEILITLKDVYWPWKLANGSTEGSNFLKAADAANHGIHMSASAPVESLFATPSNIMGSQVASARAAKNRLQRGIWTSTSFGDMRRALAATERLVLLGADRRELRDYGILLYHCGLYEPSLAYLNAYTACEGSDTETASPWKAKETGALETVLFRLRLILAEQGWNAPATGSLPITSPISDPW